MERLAQTTTIHRSKGGKMKCPKVNKYKKCEKCTTGVGCGGNGPFGNLKRNVPGVVKPGAFRVYE